MTPKEMAAKVRAMMADHGIDFTDPRGGGGLGWRGDFHMASDRLMAEVLEELGYGEAVDLIRSVPKWYE